LLASIIRAYFNVEQRYSTPLSLIKSTYFIEVAQHFQQAMKI